MPKVFNAIANSYFYHFPLHLLVIILTFLLRSYFIRGQYLITGTFLHIYAIRKCEDEASRKVVSR